MSGTPVIIVHGGAWKIPDAVAERSVEGVKAAAVIGHNVLVAGGSAVDAVEATVRCLEDNPVFDAGTGSVLNADGEVEMDSVIMEGKDLKTGAVACVQNIKNPVSLAKAVMEQTDHTLLVGKGANKFAEEIGAVTLPTEQLVTEEARQEWEEFMNFKSTVNVLFKNRTETQGHDTVGAVALDKHGHLAFATSTGGITAKKPGRVGDSPIVGAGGYADNLVGGVSTTGHGESIVKVSLAKLIIHLMDQGNCPQVAAQTALSYMTRRVGGSGGAIVLNNKGELGKHFTTDRMAWAWIKDNHIHYGLNPEEDLTKPLE